jgi:hypothetical protein
VTPPSTIVLRTARWKTALATAGSLLFVLLGLWMWHAPADSFRHPEVMVRGVAIVAIVTFGGFAVAGFARTVQPDRLILDPTGFRVDGLFSRPGVSWSEVDAFTVVEVRGRTFLAYELKPEARGRHGAPLWRIGNADGYLPAALETSQDDVMQSLAEWHRAYG